MSGGPRPGPEHTCVGCRQRAPQHELLRIARRPDGSLATGRSAGRGVYVHRERACLDRAMRVAVLARALRGRLSTDEVGRLRERVEGELESV